MIKARKKPFKYYAYTDGSAYPNPGPGGWGFVLLDANQNEVLMESFDGASMTTNNRMEIIAIYMAIKAVPSDEALWIYSDSQYSINGVMDWMYGWANKGWRDVKNAELWQGMYNLIRSREQRVHLQWVKGHSGNVWNEYADGLAEAGRIKITSELEKQRDPNTALDLAFEVAIS